MVDCESIRSKLDEYVDGTLHPLEYREVKAHLIQCDSCNKEAEELFLITESIENMHVDPPELLNKRILAKIAQDNKWRKRRYQRLVKRTAATILIAGIVYFLPRQIPVDSTGGNVAIHSRGKNVIIDGNTLHGDLTVVGGDVYVEGEIKGNVTSIDGQVSAMVDGEGFWEKCLTVIKEIWRGFTGGDSI